MLQSGGFGGAFEEDGYGNWAHAAGDGGDDTGLGLNLGVVDVADDFPLAISSATLSDPEHYAFVNDVIRNLCKQANVYPCVFDAVLFSKGDGSDWNGVKPLF